jgi:hypothetical protein
MRTLNILFLSLLLFSCGQKKPSAPVIEEVPTTAVDTVAVSTPKVALNIQTGDFREIGETGLVMFPLSLSGSERKEGKLLEYKSSSYTHGYWNVLFHDVHTGETRLLSDQRMLISNIMTEPVAVKTNSPDTARRNHFYALRTEDVNKDGELSYKDPEYLFMSAMDGSDFRQVSPAGLHLRSWTRIKSANTLLMVVSRDSNKDGDYDLSDEEFIYTFDLSKQKTPSEILSSDLKKKLRLLFERDWK